MATNHDTAPLRRGGVAPPCTMVIFGSSGDLTKRLLIPAVYNLAKSGRLSEHFALIGVDRADQSTEAFRDYLADGVRTFVSDTAMGGKKEPFDKKAWDFLAKRMHHFSGDLTDPKTYRELKKLLDQLEKEEETGGNVLFYLAVGSRLFGTIVDQIGEAGLATQKDGSWRRVIIEKPFGHDFKSAEELNTRILKTLTEDQIYRMDHFLGKETVQNIIALRFANAIFEPLWNRDHIDHVQITVAETVGVEHRAAFYEVTGALRDMVPNHVFQLLCLTAMEPPNSFAADAVRTEKQKVLDAIMRFDEDDVRRNVVRGQYGAGIVGDTERKAYVQEDGVDPKSTTETFVAMRLGIDNWRWAGVPFYLRTGKSMTRRTTEIAIQFKNVPFAMFRETEVDTLSPNVLALQIQPDEGASLQFSAKQPGPEIQIDTVRMNFRYSDYFRAAPSTGYETLVYDCMIGDATLFNRADNVEAGWAIVQPILDLWQASRDIPLALYAAGSAGPDSADELLWRSGRQWRPIT
jgi:glucose-6-phosphate 1-dehydrogenase